jgi:hypothetical protein
VTPATQSEWVASGLTPTYVSATSFTLAGDQTSAFHKDRRLKTTNSGGTVYSTITASVFGALTTDNGGERRRRLARLRALGGELRGTATSTYNPGAGGVASGGDININGCGGCGGAITIAGQQSVGGLGGPSVFGGAVPGSLSGGGNAGATNSGAGGSGGGFSGAGQNGAGGGSGGYSEKLFTAPSATYTYTIGAGGTAGTAGTSGNPGGAGAAGIIIVDEYYN